MQAEVLIVDTNQRYRTLLREQLNQISEVRVISHEAATAEGALFITQTMAIDAAILPLNFNGLELGGIALAQRLVQAHNRCALIITVEQESFLLAQTVNQCLPTNRKALFCRERNSQCLREALNEVLLDQPNKIRNVLACSAVPTHLTATEYSALVCTALGLSDSLAATINGVSIQAIQARVRSLYAALDVPSKRDVGMFPYNPRTRAVWLAFRNGILNVDELNLRAADLVRQTYSLQIDADI